MRGQQFNQPSSGARRGGAGRTAAGPARRGGRSGDLDRRRWADAWLEGVRGAGTPGGPALGDGVAIVDGVELDVLDVLRGSLLDALTGGGNGVPHAAPSGWRRLWRSWPPRRRGLAPDPGLAHGSGADIVVVLNDPAHAASLVPVAAALSAAGLSVVAAAGAAPLAAVAARAGLSATRIDDSRVVSDARLAVYRRRLRVAARRALDRRFAELAVDRDLGHDGVDHHLDVALDLDPRLAAARMRTAVDVDSFVGSLVVSLLGPGAGPDSARRAVEHTVAVLAGPTVSFAIGLRHVLLAERPRAVVVADAAGPETRSAIAVARQLGMASVAVDDGRVAEGEPTWARCAADLVCVWNDAAAAALAAAGRATGAIAVTGPPHLHSVTLSGPADGAGASVAAAVRRLLANASSASTRGRTASTAGAAAAFEPGPVAEPPARSDAIGR